MQGQNMASTNVKVHQAESGSAMVEFAIVAAVGAALIFGTLELITATLFHTKLQAVAAMGARIASAEINGLGPQSLSSAPAANTLKIGSNSYLGDWNAVVNSSASFSNTDLNIFDYVLGYTSEIFKNRNTPQQANLGWQAFAIAGNLGNILVPNSFSKNEVVIVPGAFEFDGNSRIINFPSAGSSATLSDAEEPRAVFACADSPLQTNFFSSGVMCTGFPGFNAGI